MQIAKHKRFLLAGVVAVAVVFLAGIEWSSKPDSSIPGLYRETYYRRLGGKHFRILGKPFAIGETWTPFTTEYEIKPNGRYTQHWRVPGGGRRWEETSFRPRTDVGTITLHPDGGYTKSQSGTYTRSGRDITFTFRNRRLDEWEPDLLKVRPDYFKRTRKLSQSQFIENGFLWERRTFRVTKDGFLFPLPTDAKGKPRHLSDEELHKQFREMQKRQADSAWLKRGQYNTGMRKVR